jgi:sulfatase maturation enzyme AslB (radical SAM superfamily)
MKKTFGHIQIPLQRIHLELTNVCNLNCVFCPKSVMTRPCGYMDKELAKRAISEIATNGLSEKITFHLMGEPTLHPQFFEILEHALAVKVEVGLTTNGTTLGGPVGRRLLDYELLQLDVSFQTPDEESFALRKSGSIAFQSYLEGIMGFFHDYHNRYPASIFKFRLMNTSFTKKRMERRIGPLKVICTAKELRDIVRKYSGLIYKLLDLSPPPEDIFESRLMGLVYYKWNVIEILPSVFFETYMLDGWGNAFEDEVSDAWAGFCFGMRDHFGILHSGDVVLCCMDYDGKAAIGNLNNGSLKEILSSAALKRIMDGFTKYRLIHPHCRRCLGSHSFASWVVKPIAAIVGLKVLKPYFYTHTRLFE